MEEWCYFILVIIIPWHMYSISSPLLLRDTIKPTTTNIVFSLQQSTPALVVVLLILRLLITHQPFRVCWKLNTIKQKHTSSVPLWITPVRCTVDMSFGLNFQWLLIMKFASLRIVPARRLSVVLNESLCACLSLCLGSKWRNIEFHLWTVTWE